MTFFEYLNEINRFESIENTVKYINANFIDIQHAYYTSSDIELQQNSIQVDDIFFDLFNKNLFKIGRAHV